MTDGVVDVCMCVCGSIAEEIMTEKLVEVWRERIQGERERQRPWKLPIR